MRPTAAVAALAAIVALAGSFRLYGLEHLPPGLFGDEAAEGVHAAAIAAGERFPVFIEEPAPWQWSSREPLYHYLAAPVIRVAGRSAVSLRAASALIGIATVLVVAVLGARLFGAGVGIAAGVLLAVGHWHVTLSRLGLRAVLVPFFVALVALAFTHLLRRRSLTAAVGFGALLALGFYTYPSYWTVPPALALTAAAAWFATAPAQRLASAAPWKAPAVAALAAALLVAAPLLGYAVLKPAYFFGRAASTDAFAVERPDGPPFLRDNLQRVAFMLHLRGDRNPRHNLPGRPMLDPVSGVLFLVGLAVLVRERELGAVRRVGLLAFWLLPLLPSMVTDSAPHGLRASGAIPAVALIAALGLDRLAAAAARRWARLAPAVVFTAALGAATVLGYRAYFVDYAALPGLSGAFSGEALRFVEYADSLAADHDVYAEDDIYDSPHRRFLFSDRAAAWRRLDGVQAFVAGGAARDRVFIVSDRAVLGLLRELFPNAAELARYTAPGGAKGIVHRVSRADLPVALEPSQARRVGDALRATGRREAE